MGGEGVARFVLFGVVGCRIDGEEGCSAYAVSAFLGPGTLGAPREGIVREGTWFVRVGVSRVGIHQFSHVALGRASWVLGWTPLVGCALLIAMQCHIAALCGAREMDAPCVWSVSASPGPSAPDVPREEVVGEDARFV